jgi:arsenate reductase
MIRVLFICTGNSARSQIAEAMLKKLGGRRFDVHSGGTTPASNVNPYAIEVLRERGVGTDRLTPKSLDVFLNQQFDLVITVCDKARQACPFFPGAKKMVHWSLPDPATFRGEHSEILEQFRHIRDAIEKRITDEILTLP